MNNLCRHRNAILTIHCNKRSINLTQPFQAVLQRLRNIVSVPQLRILGHQDVNLDAHSITSMVGFDAFEAVDEWREAVCHERELAVRSVVGGLAGQSSNVLEAGACPVVDDEERENGCAHRIKPPYADLVADEREQKRKRVEVYIGLAILR